MEGEEGDFGPNFSGILNGMLAQAPPPPGFRGEFDVFGTQVPMPREAFEDFTVPRIDQRIKELEDEMSGRRMDPKEEQSYLYGIKTLQQFRDIRQAKDEATKWMDTIEKDLKQFIDEFTLPELTPPGKNIEDPNLNVAVAPDLDTDIDVA